MKTECCVLSKHDQTKRPLTCQFNKYLPADHEHEGKYFCILHLPFDVKTSSPGQRLHGHAQTAFEEMIEKGEYNYRYIAVQNISIKNIPDTIKDLSFYGANLWGVNILECKSLKNIQIEDAILRGDTKIENCVIETFTILKSNISNRFYIGNTIISNQFFVKESIFHPGNSTILDPTNVFEIKNSEIDKFTLQECHIKQSMILDTSKIKELNLGGNNKYYICPLFINTKYISGTLPTKNEFDLKNLINFLKALKPKYSLKNSECEVAYIKKKRINILNKNSLKMREQHDRFLYLYNIAKEHMMILKQGEYYYFMRLCLEQAFDEGYWKRFLSNSYGVLSDYGISLLRPVVGLIITWISFSIIYFSLEHDIGQATLVSLRQIIEPFELLKSQEKSGVLQAFGFIESLFSLILFALMLLGFRWNFRKA